LLVYFLLVCFSSPLSASRRRSAAIVEVLQPK
jgi:hypothetical protein